jgi:chemotaxis protein CheD
VSVLFAEAPGPVPAIRERGYLHPGNLVVPAVPTAITTILGSCVSVCVWDWRLRLGGMNHFMLPLPSPGNAPSSRFGNTAMNELFAQLELGGSRKSSLRAHVYGGACMFPGMRSTRHLGIQNAELALAFLKARGIEIGQVDTGGSRGRKVIFNTDEGTTCLTLI